MKNLLTNGNIRALVIVILAAYDFTSAQIRDMLKRERIIVVKAERWSEYLNNDKLLDWLKVKLLLNHAYLLDRRKLPRNNVNAWSKYLTRNRSEKKSSLKAKNILSTMGLDVRFSMNSCEARPFLETLDAIEDTAVHQRSITTKKVTVTKKRTTTTRTTTATTTETTTETTETTETTTETTEKTIELSPLRTSRGPWLERVPKGYHFSCQTPAGYDEWVSEGQAVKHLEGMDDKVFNVTALIDGGTKWSLNEYVEEGKQNAFFQDCPQMGDVILSCHKLSEFVEDPLSCATKRKAAKMKRKANNKKRKFTRKGPIMAADDDELFDRVSGNIASCFGSCNPSDAQLLFDADEGTVV